METQSPENGEKTRLSQILLNNGVYPTHENGEFGTFHRNIPRDLLQLHPDLITSNDLLKWCVVNELEDDIRILIKHMDKDLAIEALFLSPSIKITRILLENGVNVNGKHNGLSLIHYAIKSNNIELVKLLFEFNVNWNQSSDLGYPACIAVQNQNFQILQTLVNSGVCLSLYNPELIEILAPKLTDRDMITYIIEKSSNVSLYKTGFLHLIAKHANIANFLNLINFNEEVNEEDTFELTPLYYACQSNYKNAKILIENGANVNHRTSSGFTPLLESIRYHQPAIYHMLIEHGADINATCGFSAVILAMVRNEPNAFHLLYNNGVDLEQADFNGETPLMTATSNPDYLDYMRLMLQRVQVNTRDNNGRTALYHAVLNRNLQAVNLLISNGADVELDAYDKSTPIYKAVESNDVELVRLLIVHGAKVENLRGNDLIGELLINCGNGIGMLSLVQLCRISLRDTFGKNYLRMISCNNLPVTLKRYLMFGLDVNDVLG